MLVGHSRAIAGRPTEYLADGDGDAIVFLHGGGIVEGFDCLRPLAARHRLVVPLMPGFGGTSIDPPIRSRDELVEHTSRVLDDLGLTRFVLVGHSVGGWHAAAIAAALGDRVSRLVLAAPYGFDVAGHPVADVGAMSAQAVLALLTNDQTIWHGRVPAQPDPVFEAARRLEDESLERFMPGPFDPGLETVVASIRQPTLILWGDDDRITPVQHAAAWQRAIAHADLELFEGAGHLLFHERPAAVEAVADFAAERTQRSV